MSTVVRIFHPRREDITLASVLHALGDPIRLAIIRQLSDQGSATCLQTFPDPIAKSTLSHHLRILRESGVIHTKKMGREYNNTLRTEDLNSLFPGLLTAVLCAKADG